MSQLVEYFRDSFMKPEIYQGFYFEVDTTEGVEIIPTEVAGRNCQTDVSFLRVFLHGEPLDDTEPVNSRAGWIARLSAPGYMDCTDWTAHATKEAAEQYLIETYGE